MPLPRLKYFNAVDLGVSMRIKYGYLLEVRLKCE